MSPEARQRHAVYVRQATSEDALRISELSTQLGYLASKDEVERRLAEILNDPDHVVSVAVLADGRVIGWLHGFICRFIESGRRVEIGGLVVDEHHRRSSAGGMLMQRAEAWAREKKCEAVNLRSNVVREVAQAFYKSLGYELVKTQHAFRKIL